MTSIELKDRRQLTCTCPSNSAGLDQNNLKTSMPTLRQRLFYVINAELIFVSSLQNHIYNNVSQLTRKPSYFLSASYYLSPSIHPSMIEHTLSTRGPAISESNKKSRPLNAKSPPLSIQLNPMLLLQQKLLKSHKRTELCAKSLLWIRSFYQ
jgi:hypothetical protein